MNANYAQFADANVRLIILRALAEEVNSSLNDAMLLATLENFGHYRTKDYLRNQLAWLAREVGAVTTREAGTAVIATLTQAGLDHVERRRVLEGVQRPGLDV
jgi:hypothetical protein